MAMTCGLITADTAADPPAQAAGAITANWNTGHEGERDAARARRRDRQQRAQMSPHAYEAGIIEVRFGFLVRCDSRCSAIAIAPPCGAVDRIGSRQQSNA